MLRKIRYTESSQSICADGAAGRIGTSDGLVDAAGKGGYMYDILIKGGSYPDFEKQQMVQGDVAISEA